VNLIDRELTIREHRHGLKVELKLNLARTRTKAQLCSALRVSVQESSRPVGPRQGPHQERMITSALVRCKQCCLLCVL
jgi:hypothetical protein